MLKIGSHVSMSGKDMLLGSAKEAISYNANTFMVYTGAPQNTRRKNVEDLNIEAAKTYMTEHNIDEFIIHAPYIINLANSINPDIFELAVNFLSLELNRTALMGSHILVLHPGSHVGAGNEVGIKQIVSGLNEVLSSDKSCYIALETMSGKGSELGRSFEDLAQIYDGVKQNDRLRVCFDTCHVHDAGYDIVHDLDGVLEQFDRLIGKGQIAVFHINDSKNPKGARKDRHENIGFGHIGFEALSKVVHHEAFYHVPKILETPYIPLSDNSKKSFPPYKHEIEMLLNKRFNPNLKENIITDYLSIK
ncbi:endonuclease IV [Lachnotalea glycerini]|jgi:deoxyribonuclease IV|uniref:Probable endonuclease 4 n=1 Tax=Lachnotalea glycerini TaxID=1763509 RepID=A0A318EK63_9FIRM|nr:deoxyribonuclease IV [Lachnotalea glycerini]PXV86010.1 endonuclease IV [Lachnotalea glycerini]